MRDVIFVGTSRADLKAFPIDIRRQAGITLREVQIGALPTNAKPLKGFGGAGVQELRLDDQSGTYRVVYAVSLPDAVYVLHAFQKKSRRGIKTDARDVERVRQRLRIAQQTSAERER